jgi:hypothetical protein
MISDEPDEDALDDETLLESYAGLDPSATRSESSSTPDTRDWPPSSRTDTVMRGIDAGTLAWFEANRTDWRSELDLVLRAWIAGQTPPSPDAQPSD